MNALNKYFFCWLNLTPILSTLSPYCTHYDHYSQSVSVSLEIQTLPWMAVLFPRFVVCEHRISKLKQPHLWLIFFCCCCHYHGIPVLNNELELWICINYSNQIWAKARCADSRPLLALLTKTRYARKGDQQSAFIPSLSPFFLISLFYLFLSLFPHLPPIGRSQVSR